MMEIRRRSPYPKVSVQSLTYKIEAPGAEPQNILERIVWQKEKEVKRQRQQISLADLQREVLSAPPAKDFLAALQNSDRTPALVAEVKKASPSRGVIREDFDPVAIAQAYQTGGATCLSVLTDETFFQGSFDYLTQVRTAVDLPVLCKEFIIYPYQMYMARVKGADAVLLIAAILSDEDLRYFTRIAQALGMRALVEVHTLAELDRALAIDTVHLIGINNRNLETFQTSLEVSETLLQARQAEIEERAIFVISESGIHRPNDVAKVHQAGAQGILVGESLMRQNNLVEAIAHLYP
ncbi:indole-3-glycerol phosphate synthase TrpC [Oscillatoria sp. CS-180]|uniref:indole-3-glycerol phosphate synthase TrpC n=1 Tax=Oscillatoria sp. CS-180 TaxID=3021720 RepID=UPI00232BABC4|nr:indole-3-glycerol phosphate synthase TrpC [Oscillatoria sp. CS-180]MDB9528843.1 indole-3-glycerol phosphate synthase TrpC [Oscillatoria sp. CS-180]